MTDHIKSTLDNGEGWFKSEGDGTKGDPWKPTTGVVNTPGSGGIDVNVQDQTSPPFDLFFSRANGPPTTIAEVAVSIESLNKDIIVADATNIEIGDYLGIFSGDSDEGRYYWGDVIGKAGNVITMDSPIDYPFVAGDTVLSTSRNLAVDGSITPQIFSIQAGDSGIQLDVTRIMIAVISQTLPLLTSFGDIDGGLTNGIVLRFTDGEIRNYFNWKSNYDIGVYAFDASIYDSSHPTQDLNGMKARFTYGGQSKHGVVLRVGPNESLDIIIQDDLSSLIEFNVIAEGHLVVD